MGSNPTPGIMKKVTLEITCRDSANVNEMIASLLHVENVLDVTYVKSDRWDELDTLGFSIPLPR